MCQKLLCKGANVNLSDKNGTTALHFASSNNNKKLVSILLSLGANANKLSTSQDAPLHIAVFYGFLDIASLLISKKANCDLRDTNGETPLHVVCKEKNLDTRVEIGKKDGNQFFVIV
jgi:ankyrin repeat protein